jgi:hypothetical protein
MVRQFCVVSEPEPTRPFFLIVIDEDRGVFSVEGPMTDDRPWQSAARKARDDERHVVCGPAGAERDAIAAESRRERKMAVFRRAASSDQSVDCYLKQEAKKRPPQRTGAASDGRRPVERSGRLRSVVHGVARRRRNAIGGAVTSPSFRP